jgi:SAM-dependent methyltransferase
MSDVMPSPARILDAFTAYQRTAAIKAAVELDVFTAIGDGADTVAELARRCAASERGLRSLCDRLVVDGFLTKDGARYALTLDAALFLTRSSPGYLGSMVTFMASPTIVAGFERLTEAVRRGGTAMGQENALAPEHPVWVEFARAMAPGAGFTAQQLLPVLDVAAAPRLRVLDVAAGHGMYGIILARENPRAEIVALDWANVLAVAEENARAAGVTARYRTIPGSAFTRDFGGGYDLVLLTNFLHHFDPPTCERLLAKAHAALVPGGRVAAVEFVPHEDRVSPPDAASFSLAMLASTPAGDAWTLAEYERMFHAAGFARPTLHELTPSPQQAVVARRE